MQTTCETAKSIEKEFPQELLGIRHWENINYFPQGWMVKGDITVTHTTWKKLYKNGTKLTEWSTMTNARGILSFFPSSKQPRPGQTKVLLELEACWDKYDVHVLQLPVAFGKTSVARTVQSWALGRHKLKSHYAVPNNALLEQLRQDNPRACILEKRDNYRCTAVREDAVMPDASCGSRHAAQGSHCAECPYVKAVRAAHGVPVSASNYHTLMAHKLQKPVLVFDEAHLLIPLVRELEGTHLWLHKLPGTAASGLRRVETYEELYAWLQANPELLRQTPALRQVEEQLRLGGTKWLVSKEPQMYHGQLRDCLALLPLDTRHSTKAGQLWPSKKVQKLVLMSATVHMQDIEQLGLAGKRVKFYSGESAIPASNRPWAYLGKEVGSMSHALQAQNLGRCVEALRRLAILYGKNQGGKGLVHAPYSLAGKLWPLLRAALVGTGVEVYTHNTGNKLQVFADWQAHKGPAVLVGSGFEEGVDLAGPDYTWQAIAKVQFPSLEEPAFRWLAEQEPQRYAWITAQKLLQSYGRICRRPDDFGATFILDGAFNKFYNSHTELFPEWFTEARRDS
jgi:Rad3-related DNA helicase